MSFRLAETFNSVPGIAHWVDSSCAAKNRLTAPLIKKIPLFKTIHLIDEFDLNIKREGLVEASRIMLDRLRFTINIEGEVPMHLKKEGSPLIVISNHDGLIEPIFVTKLIGRNDHKIIAGIENVRFGDAFANHLLPVRPRKYAGEKASILYGQAMTREEITKLNDESLSNASKKVEEGSMLTTFPWGGRNHERGQWHKGLGRIIHGIPTDIQGEINILPIFFSGHDRNSLIALISELLIYGSPTKNRHIRAIIGHPINISNIRDSSGDPEVTIQNIKNIYLRQFASR